MPKRRFKLTFAFESLDSPRPQHSLEQSSFSYNCSKTTISLLTPSAGKQCPFPILVIPRGIRSQLKPNCIPQTPLLYLVSLNLIICFNRSITNYCRHPFLSTKISFSFPLSLCSDITNCLFPFEQLNDVILLPILETIHLMFLSQTFISCEPPVLGHPFYSWTELWLLRSWNYLPWRFT